MQNDSFEFKGLEVYDGSTWVPAAMAVIDENPGDDAGPVITQGQTTITEDSIAFTFTSSPASQRFGTLTASDGTIFVSNNNSAEDGSTTGFLGRTTHSEIYNDLSPGTTYTRDTQLLTETGQETVISGTVTTAGVPVDPDPDPEPTGPVVTQGETTTTTNSITFTFTTSPASQRFGTLTSPEGTVFVSNNNSAEDGSTTGFLGRTTHSEVYNGLSAGTVYTRSTRLVTETGLETTVAGSFITAGVPADPDPTPDPDPVPGTMPLDRSDYPSGWQTWTAIYWCPPGSSFSSPGGQQVVKDRRLVLDDNTDYRVFCPEPFINTETNKEISGGRNYICFGFQSEFTRSSPTSTYPAGYFPIGRYQHNQNVDPRIANTALRINGRFSSSNNSDTLFRCFEGLYIKGQYHWEGVNYDCQSDRGANTVLMFQNCRSDQINWIKPASGGGHYGGDVFQPWRGPGRLRIRGFTAKECTYQGFFLQQCGADGTWFPRENVVEEELTRLELHGSATWGNSIILWETQRSNTGIQRVFGAKGTDQGIYVNSESGTNQTSYLGTIFQDATTFGPNPHGDFVPANQSGLNYPYTPSA